MENDNNDTYGFIGFSINYKFRKANKAEKEKYKDVNFKIYHLGAQFLIDCHLDVCVPRNHAKWVQDFEAFSL